MRLLIHQSELKAGISAVSGIVPSRPVMPVLGNILMRTTERGLELRTTDLEAAITYSCTARIDQHGAITVPTKLLVDLVNNLPFDIVDMQVNGFTTFIKCGTFECQINGLDPEEYPSIPDVTGDAITMDAKPLRDALMKSMTAVATDDSRPVLTAIRIALTPTEMVMVSADGFRLSKVQFPVTHEATITAWQNVLVPAKTINQLIKAMPITDTVTITKSASMIQFVLPKATYTSRLIEGTYPDVERVFPREFVNRMVVDTVDLRQALKVARLLHTTVRIAIMDESIVVSANDSSRGNGRTMVSVVRSGQTHSLALNVDYLDDALAACGTPKIVMETNSETLPALIRPMGDDNYWHIVMPMMVR